MTIIQQVKVWPQVIPVVCVGESTMPMGLIYVWYFLLLLTMLYFYGLLFSFYGLLLFSVAHHETWKQFGQSQALDKVRACAVVNLRYGMPITDTHTSIPRQSK